VLQTSLFLPFGAGRPAGVSGSIWSIGPTRRFRLGLIHCWMSPKP